MLSNEMLLLLLLASSAVSINSSTGLTITTTEAEGFFAAAARLCKKLARRRREWAWSGERGCMLWQREKVALAKSHAACREMLVCSSSTAGSAIERRGPMQCVCSSLLRAEGERLPSSSIFVRRRGGMCPLPDWMLSCQKAEVFAAKPITSRSPTRHLNRSLMLSCFCGEAALYSFHAVCAASLCMAQELSIWSTFFSDGSNTYCLRVMSDMCARLHCWCGSANHRRTCAKRGRGTSIKNDRLWRSEREEAQVDRWCASSAQANAADTMLSL